jgi:hypothetical protein
MCWKKVSYITSGGKSFHCYIRDFVTVVFVFACKLHSRVSQPMYGWNATLSFTEKLELCEVQVCLVKSEFCSALLNLSPTYLTSKLLPTFCSADAESYPAVNVHYICPFTYLCNNTYRLENNGHYVLTWKGSGSRKRCDFRRPASPNY